MAKFYYGGQAVIEGVMMRGRNQATVVVRNRQGELVQRTEVLSGALYKKRIAQLPFVRGLVMLWEMLVLGTRMMLFSANVQARASAEREIPSSLVAIMLAVSLTFAIGVFFVLPLLVARGGGGAIHGSIASNAFEGLIRLLLFAGYLALIGQFGQMKRVFQYHGAEHKTINAYEHGAELSPRSVQRFSTVHIRCGTAFLLWVVVLSIFIFGLLGHPPLLIGILARVVLVPLIAALSYEILRFGARFYDVAPVRAVLQPGLWLQHLTTREPSDDQVEVAIAALRPVLASDGLAQSPSEPMVASF
jgi:uncharacterized protein YqhQ